MYELLRLVVSELAYCIRFIAASHLFPKRSKQARNSLTYVFVRLLLIRFGLSTLEIFVEEHNHETPR